MELLVILLLVMLNGIFAMSELALVSSKKFKLDQAEKKGSSGAKTAIELSEDPTKFLSTVQIGITLIGILLGVYSGENLTNDVRDFLNQYEFMRPYANQAATVIIVVFITYLSIVLGELLPKRLGMTFPEPIITLLAKPMKLLSIITSPFVWLLTVSNNTILRILGIKNRSDQAISEEEIKSIIKESAEVGEIEVIEQDIVTRVFEMGDRKVSSMLTHRRDLVYFNITDSWDEINAKMMDEIHSAYPVAQQNNLDELVGIVLLKDLFSAGNDPAFNLADYVIEPVYFNENTNAYLVLESFKRENLHYAMVVDEYGTITGMVTMDDVMDALIGDSPAPHQKAYQIVERNENSWLVDGQYSVAEFYRYFDLTPPEAQQNEYVTVAGLLIYTSKTIPNVGEKIEIGDLTFEVVDKDGQRIDKIMVTRNIAPEQE